VCPHPGLYSSIELERTHNDDDCKNLNKIIGVEYLEIEGIDNTCYFKRGNLNCVYDKDENGDYNFNPDKSSKECSPSDNFAEACKLENENLNEYKYCLINPLAPKCHNKFYNLNLMAGAFFSNAECDSCEDIPGCKTITDCSPIIAGSNGNTGFTLKNLISSMLHVIHCPENSQKSPTKISVLSYDCYGDCDENVNSGPCGATTQTPSQGTKQNKQTSLWW